MKALRLGTGYAVLAAGGAAIAALSFHAGSGLHAAPVIAGSYRVVAGRGCLDGEVAFTQSGEFVHGAGAELRLQHDRLTGRVRCTDGSHRDLALDVAGKRLAGGGVVLVRMESHVAPAAPLPNRSGEDTFGRLMIAIAVVILTARLVRGLVGKIGQPPVMGEVLAGILLGGTLLGAVLPDVENYLFPADIVPLIVGASQIGLAFYMFLVGLEIEPGLLRGRVAQAAFVSNASVVVPFALGLVIALPVYPLLAPEVSYAPFALFMGVSMSITAFPVLARILTERRMIKRPIGAVALASAAVDDVTAWGLLALATAVATTGKGLEVVRVVGLAIVFCAAMGTVGRRLLGRVSTAYDEAGHIPPGWIATIFAGVMVSAYVAHEIGIAAIFGAFVMGLIMPRRADLTHEVSRRSEDFVVVVLLPLFFVVTGLRMHVGALDRLELWLWTLVLIGIAIAGKLGGALLAARYGGFRWRESAALATLLNTRGLTELIVINIGLSLGVLSADLFTMLVIMALVTTFMTAPLLRLVDPHGELSAPAEEELRETVRPRGALERSILVAPLDERNLDALLRLAEPLARSEPPRELILARLLPPSRLPTSLEPQDRQLRHAAQELNRRRARLLADGVAARSVAFTSPELGADLVRLASEKEVDLIILDGRRPLLGEGVPRGDVGEVLERAPCDVAVLVERVRAPSIGPDRPVVVPFGGAEHDWAALELAAWIASERGAPLRLLGPADASRLLGNASLVVQQLAGLAAEPTLVEPGREGLLRAAEDAGLLVVGLSERWRAEGLGPVRSEIARAAPAPTLFVRRGTRPGALAPRDEPTRFAWSRI
jgi:Kef-type K+ transport system membrane component KefB